MTFAGVMGKHASHDYMFLGVWLLQQIWREYLSCFGNIAICINQVEVRIPFGMSHPKRDADLDLSIGRIFQYSQHCHFLDKNLKDSLILELCYSTKRSESFA